MDQGQWNALLLRIGPHDTDDLDTLLAPFDRRPDGAGRDVFPLPDAILMPEAALKRGDAVCVGSCGAQADATVTDRAMRVAAFAIERDVQVVVLTAADRCGFEPFGFRIERVAGDDPDARAACEDQIRRFWNLDLIF